MTTNWYEIKGYRKNDPFDDFKGISFTLEDFIAKCKDEYNLKEITCKMKLKRGVKEGLVVQRGESYKVVV